MSTESSGPTLQNLENAESATEDYVRIETRRRQRAATAARGEETRNHIEHADDPETVTVDVGGEQIAFRPLGVGERLRPIQRVQRAERDGDDLATAEAIIGMIDTMADAADGFYDPSFFDTLSEDDLRAAYRELSEKSSGGNAPRR